MDTTRALEHAHDAAEQLAEKAERSGFDVRTTAAWHTNEAVLALIAALNGANRETPPAPVVPAAPRTGLDYEQHTSPYRHHRGAVDTFVQGSLHISARELAKDMD